MKYILFVDDEKSVLNGLKRSLRGQRNEWQMEFAESGQDALRLFREQPFDAVVTDMRMPGMDGNQLLNQVASNYPETIRFILSGHSDEEMILRSAGPAHQFLAKPCTPEHLKNSLTRAFALKDYLGDERLQSFVSGLESLPSIPAVYNEIRTKLQSPEVTLREIGEVVGKDPAMTAKILQLVNSAFFGLGRRVSNVGEAATLIGIEALKALVLSVGIFSQFDSEKNNDPDFSLEALWNHCMAVAAGAKRIAKAEGAAKEVIDDSFLAGVLHDIGILIMEQNFSEEHAKVRALSVEQGLTLQQAEREIFGTTHGAIGAYLLGLWALADPVVEAVAFHHEPSLTEQRGFSPLAAVHVANMLDRTGMPEGMLVNSRTGDDAFLAESGLLDRVEQWRELLEDEE
jgi:HD-like signal output (HDOD) protein